MSILNDHGPRDDAPKTKTDQDRQIASTNCYRPDRSYSYQNSFDMIWDSGKAWTDGIFLLAGATSLPEVSADHAPKIPADIPPSNLKSS